MSKEITLTSDEIKAIETKVSKSDLSDSERALLNAVLANARAAQATQRMGDPGWYFSWTYRF